MISKNLDTKRYRMFKIELSDAKFEEMKKAVGKTGLKQQAWMSQAILEKIAREAPHADDQR